MATSLVGLGACASEVDIDGAALLDEDAPVVEFRAMQGPYPGRDQRALSKPIDEALANLACQNGADLNTVKEYDAGNHVQTMIYTGPFSDNTSRVWYARSDGDGAYEDHELRRNKVSSSQLEWNGTIEADGGDIAHEKNSNVSGEDHVAQLEWLPDYGSDSSYEAGYLFVAAEDSKDVRVLYHHKDNSGDPSEVTTGNTRLQRNDGGKINQVYILHRNGWYWLAIGESSNFEVWVAEESELFPSGAGSLDPTAFSYHAEMDDVGGGGANCFFVTDSEDDVYRLCYKNSSDSNCYTSSGNDNYVQATAVTVPNNPNSGTFSIAGSTTHSVNLGSWGQSSAECVTECRGMRQPSFRWSGTHYVDADGNLNVYSLAAGGESGMCASSGSSDGRVKFCAEDIYPYALAQATATNVVELSQSTSNSLSSTTMSSSAVITGRITWTGPADGGARTLVEIGGSTNGINLTLINGELLMLHGASGGIPYLYGSGPVSMLPGTTYSFLIEIDTVDDKIALYWHQDHASLINARTDALSIGTLMDDTWAGPNAIGLGEINGSAAGDSVGNFNGGYFFGPVQIFEQVDF
ncbi:hypothetical protein [Enhygromyxa salina]|nr:hypothetical protein [Enhygromyxa salina]